jgi:signal transduction histidine kinase
MKSRVISRQVGHPRHAVQASLHIARAKEPMLHIGVPAAVVVALIALVLTRRSLPTPVAPPGAPLILAGITLVVAAAVRWFRFSAGVDGVAAQSLPDPLFALYLAVVILTGIAPAVVLAAVAPLLASGPDIVRHPARLREALRLSAGAALTTCAAGVVYMPAGGSLATRLAALHGHFFRAVLASVVMLLGIACMRALDQHARGAPFVTAWTEYLKSPTLRFQALLLSIGPLLPLTEVLDDLEAEFAWLLFLVPLCAVYYLALVSVRLQQRTDELQVTVGQLGVARRREAELTDYAALVTRAQEDERRRLARELHDDTAQALIALSRGLDALAARPDAPPLSAYDTHFIGELGELANRTLDSVRRACQDLRPSVLDDLGLAAALESLAHAVTQRGLNCTFQREGEIQPCAPEVEVTIYRIAQEALSNARQHAVASAATLSIDYQLDSIVLRVEDNGAGFDVDGLLRTHNGLSKDEQDLRPGLGLMGMRERAGLIGARLQVRSKPGKGTVVELLVPPDRSHLDG